jgi:hypothetical protein
MMWLTARAAVTNINATYFMPSFLVLGAVIALVTRDATPLTADLLMSFGFVLSFSIALLVGTTLAEIKVKPLSCALPGQETSMAPAALVVGVLICLGLAVLVLARPMSAGDIPAMAQALAVFGYGLGAFMLFVTVCVMTRDTAYTSLAGALAFLLVFGALGNPTLRAVQGHSHRYRDHPGVLLGVHGAALHDRVSRIHDRVSWRRRERGGLCFGAAARAPLQRDSARDGRALAAVRRHCMEALLQG